MILYVIITNLYLFADDTKQYLYTPENDIYNLHYNLNYLLHVIGIRYFKVLGQLTI